LSGKFFRNFQKKLLKKTKKVYKFFFQFFFRFKNYSGAVREKICEPENFLKTGKRKPDPHRPVIFTP